MTEYKSIEYCVNHVIAEITRRDVEQVSERLHALGWEEVVRCRDCKHYEPEWTSEVHPEWHWCDECGFYRKPDGFCAWGERK